MNPMQTFREVITEHNAQLDQGLLFPFILSKIHRVTYVLHSPKLLIEVLSKIDE